MENSSTNHNTDRQSNTMDNHARIDSLGQSIYTNIHAGLQPVAVCSRTQLTDLTYYTPITDHLTLNGFSWSRLCTLES
jgi:hypothetical protein